MADWVKSAISLSATILVASLSYSLLERPILSLKDRFFYWPQPRTD
ncbi:MAG TPA: hypothetical protein VK249_19495 [Anaerolineales bacterium]|nr:hypothetical protein [Anaerolineales bacterium]